jgi:DNA adenine methylase
MNDNVQAPFPYNGGKSRVSDEVWRRFGDLGHYVEPFCGSAAVLWNIPHDVEVRNFTINDADGLVVNFWRTVKNAPDDLLDKAQTPSSSVEQAARNNYVFDRIDDLRDKLVEDPTFYDVRCAAYWWYVRSSAVGPRGVCREKFGIRKVYTDGGGRGLHSTDNQRARLGALQDHLEDVRILCTDWRNAVTDSVLDHAGKPVGVFLDPPYPVGDTGVYGRCNEDGIYKDVQEWALEYGDRNDTRVAFCGYAGLVDMPDRWDQYHWTSQGAHAESGDGNRDRECIWFSPECLSTYTYQVPLPEEFFDS